MVFGGGAGVCHWYLYPFTARTNSPRPCKLMQGISYPSTARCTTPIAIAARRAIRSSCVWFSTPTDVHNSHAKPDTRPTIFFAHSFSVCFVRSLLPRVRQTLSSSRWNISAATCMFRGAGYGVPVPLPHAHAYDINFLSTCAK